MQIHVLFIKRRTLPLWERRIASAVCASDRRSGKSGDSDATDLDCMPLSHSASAMKTPCPDTQ